MDIKLGIAQLNPTVGALEQNAEKAVGAIEQAKRDGVDILVFPEMFITGYPPNDLLLREEFITGVQSIMFNRVLAATKGICVVIGDVRKLWSKLRNCAVVMQDEHEVGTVIKTLLPNYDVFDEKRYFEGLDPRDISPVRVKVRGQKIMLGVEVCEDLWDKGYDVKVTELLCKRGTDIIINISSSPFYTDKFPVRVALVKKYVDKFRVPFVYANTVGGQDDLVFDGGSFIFDSDGACAAALPQFKESIEYAVLNTDTWKKTNKEKVEPEKLCVEEQILRAHVLNVRDYYEKQGCFDGIVVGSSGGIDSAYTLYVASKAVGKDKVLSVAMPSKFTSKDSLDLAEQLAKSLEVNHVVLPIKNMYSAAVKTYEKAFGKTEFSVAEENDQARCRMMLLMKLSAKNKYLVCSTGNKSELSVGYFTLYGDSAGGKNIPGDLYKTQLYDVCRYINESSGDVIPDSIISRAPTAELKSNQKDTDSLPPYEVLDKILELVESDDMEGIRSLSQTVDVDVIDKVLAMYKRAEFKRDQLCRGIKVSKKAFGIGRRIPITSGWEYKCPTYSMLRRKIAERRAIEC